MVAKCGTKKYFHFSSPLFVCKAFIKMFATVSLGKMKKRLACAGALAATAALSNGKEVITADGRKVRRKEPSKKI